MGAMQAAEMATLTDARTAMAWHLQGNHYPPVPSSMVDPCLDAIEACNNGDPERKIDLPFDGVDRNGEPFQITWRGNAYAPAWAIVEGHHLHSWIDSDEDEYYED
jgi:hypothetical protein